MKGLLTGLAKFAAGSAVGATIGASVAALFAPQSGEELKQSVNRRLEAGKQARAEAEDATRRAMQEEFRRMVGDDAALRETPEPPTPPSSQT